MKGDIHRYLVAKESVDDRALDRDVLGRFRTALSTREGPLVLEAGAGAGAVLRRLLGFELPSATWLAVDTDADALELASERVTARARARGYSVVNDAHADADFVDVTASSSDVDCETVSRLAIAPRAAADASLRVVFVAGDARAVARAVEHDLLVAQAFVDLLSPPDAVALVASVADGGAAYLPITFDGETAFEPSHPDDAAVVGAYHAVMDTDGRLGSTAATRLQTLLAEAGVDVASVGASEWLVRPVDGTYPGDESYFLRVILDTVAETVRGRLPDDVVDRWLSTRQRQRNRGELVYRAANRDLYCRR